MPVLLSYSNCCLVSPMVPTVQAETATELTKCFRTASENISKRTTRNTDTSRVRGRLTFSSPKNLSRPSSRIGPAYWSSFSKGVSSGADSSLLFLFFGEALLPVPVMPWRNSRC